MHTLKNKLFTFSGARMPIGDWDEAPLRGEKKQKKRKKRKKEKTPSCDWAFN